MNLFEPSKDKKLYQEVAITIAQKLQNKEYLPGERLPSERTLAELLSVSRATIREAVIALEILGYVEIQTGSGIYVTHTPSIHKDLATSHQLQHDVTPYEFLELRLLIEPDFAAMAASEATESDIETLKQLKKDTEQIRSLREYYFFDKKFHHLIARLTKSSLANTITSSIWDKAEKSLIPANFNKHFVTRKSWEISLIEHNEIIDAIIEKDPKMAKNAMHSHLVRVMLRLRQDF